jgi:MOSC domain-containing protein YiiM
VQQQTQMRVISVNVGLPRPVPWHNTIVTTGIFKQPATGSVAIHRLNLDGDQQADLSAHGGPNKAVYAYPAVYYERWRTELPDVALPWGMFGENLTVEGPLDDTVHIGDRFRVGSALLAVTQPRLPCYKLGIKFGRDDVVERFLAVGLTGCYFAVVEAGEVAAGDTIELVQRGEHDLTIADVVRLFKDEYADPVALARAAQLQTLSGALRSHFARRAAQTERRTPG